MPLPRWLAQINKRTFNKLEIKRGVRPVLINVGRTSGRIFHTPLDAHPVDNGWLFIMNYGPESDWVKNILAAGTATLSIEGEETALDTPRVITKEEALRILPETTKMPPAWTRVRECLQMDVAVTS